MSGFTKKNIEYTQRNGNSQESKNVVKYITQGGIGGKDGADAFLAYITPQNHTIPAGPMYATDGQPDKIISVLVFRGGVQLPANIGTITGLPSGITITPQSNGTLNAHLLVHVTSTLSEDGSVNIPISYNVDTTSTTDSSIWDTSIYNIATTNAVYSWTLAKSSTSLWVLDLTNETAKINADSSGNIDASAYRPECQARLAFGSNNELEGVYYSVSTGDASVQGVGVNHSTGELILDYNNVPFQFGDLDNTILEIRFDASYEGTVRGSKVMTIEKSLPGQSGPAGSTPYIGADGYWYIDGQSLGVKAEGENGTTPHIGPNGNWWIGSQDTGVKAEGTEGAAAVTRWLSLSADQVKVDASNNVIPNKIYATAYKQTGGETPTTDSSTVIKWANDSSITNTVYTSSGVSVVSTWNYITFKLYDENGSTYLGESETVPVLRDGKNGEPGGVGPRGAIIRGPVEWDPSVVRRYCSGAQNGSDSQYHPEDASYIDIVLKDSSLYQCIVPFTQNSGDAWKGSSNWQLADNECNFIATKLLLAKNAKIDFLTGNELYLTDANGNISGGGRAAGNGSDVIFWAGSDASTGNISNAQFQVDYQGNLKATSGTFAGYVQMPYKFIAALQKDLENYYIADASAYLIADEYLTDVYYGNDAYSQGPILKLPEPSRALNGFTYHILIWPNIATRASDQNPALSIVTVNGNAKFLIPAFACDTALTVSPRKKIAFYAGHVEITCIPRREDNSTDPDDWTYYWMITMCTGGIELYNNSNLRAITDAYGPIYGYSPTDNYYVPVKIQTENNPSSDRKRDTIYITLP